MMATKTHTKTDNVFSTYVRQAYEAQRLLMKVIRRLGTYPRRDLQVVLPKTRATVDISARLFKDIVKSVETAISRLDYVHRTIISAKRGSAGTGLTYPRYIDLKLSNFFAQALRSVRTSDGRLLLESIRVTTGSDANPQVGIVNMPMITTLFTLYVKSQRLTKISRNVILDERASLFINTFRDEFALCAVTKRKDGRYDNFLGPDPEGNPARSFTSANFQTIIHNLTHALPKSYEEYVSKVPPTVKNAIETMAAGIISARGSMAAAYDDVFQAIVAELANQLEIVKATNKAMPKL